MVPVIISSHVNSPHCTRFVAFGFAKSAAELSQCAMRQATTCSAMKATGNAGIGRQTTNRVTSSGIPKKHRFGIREKDREPEARVPYNRVAR